MKVNLKNYRFVKKLTQILIALAVLNIIFGSGIILLLFDLLISLGFIILLRYVIGVLQFAGEDISIQNPFSIFLGIQVVILLSNILAIIGFKAIDLSLAYSVLTILISFYMMLMCFKVKNTLFSQQFKILGISIILILVFKLTVILLLPVIAFSISSISELPVLVFLLAILNIINKSGKVLNADLSVNNIKPLP